MVMNNKCIEKKILDLSMMIKNTYPELSKYIEELPDIVSNYPQSEIKRVELHNYYQTLISILKKYIEVHPEYEL